MSTGTGAMAQAAYRLELAEIEQHRMMPRNIEAEQALLGAILINNAAFYHVSDFLRPNHFFEPLHGTIYEIANGLISANKAVGPAPKNI